MKNPDPNNPDPNIPNILRCPNCRELIDHHTDREIM